MPHPNFKERSHQLELMDTEKISFEEFHDCLNDLETINHLTFAYRPTLKWLKNSFKSLNRLNIRPEHKIKIIDVGSGGGDMLRQIWKWGKKRCIPMELIGIDLNPWSKKSAMQKTPKEAPMRFETANIFEIPENERADFIISSLFTHHLSDADLIRFIKWMDMHAIHGWFINDLHRHPLPYYTIKYIVKIMRLNRLVQHDAPVSVARAFTASDWKNLLTKANFQTRKIQIRWFFPFRYTVARHK